MERDLHAGVAGLGAQVEPVQVGQLLAGDQPEPEVERHRLRVAGVVGQPLAGLEIGVLEDVVGIDPAREAAVEPEPDQPPQPVALGVEQRGEARLVSAPGRGPAGLRARPVRVWPWRRSTGQAFRITGLTCVRDVTTNEPWSRRARGPFNTNRS